MGVQAGVTVGCRQRSCVGGRRISVNGSVQEGACEAGSPICRLASASIVAMDLDCTLRLPVVGSPAHVTTPLMRVNAGPSLAHADLMPSSALFLVLQALREPLLTTVIADLSTLSGQDIKPRSLANC